MILVDPSSVWRFQPRKDKGPTYLLKVPSVSDRIEYRRQLNKVGARLWARDTMIDSLVAGVNEIMQDEADRLVRDSILKTIEEYRETLRVVNQEVEDGTLGHDGTEKSKEALERTVKERSRMPQKLVDADMVVTEHVPSHSQRKLDNELYAELSGLVVCRMFLMGWEGIKDGDGNDVPFSRPNHGMVPDEMLYPIPRLDMIKIGIEVEGLMEPNPAHLKNLRLESGSSAGQTPSNGTGMPLATDPSPTTTGAALS